MIIHLYALCWNESVMIPYFLMHYSHWVDRIFIYDDGSEDNSKNLLVNDSKVVFSTTDEFRNEGRNMVNFEIFYNEVWKKSRGKADWVILCNLDEHFYFDGDIRNYLNECKERGFTYIPSSGYDMVGAIPKRKDLPLYKQLKKGTRRHAFDKTFAFNPMEICESVFFGGRHQALPTGNIVYPEKFEIKLLHFKYFGFFNFIKKESKKKTRLKVYKSSEFTKATIYMRKLIMAKQVILK